MDTDDLKYFITDPCNNILLPCKNFPIANHCNRLDDPECRGDLLLAIGLFAVIGYLGKIYWMLSHDINKNIKGEFYEINETDAFTYMILHLPQEVLARLNLESLQTKTEALINSFWKDWRNNLSHLLTPDSAKTVTTDDLDWTTPFTQHHGGWWECNVFALTQNLPFLISWLEEEVDKASPARVQVALHYIMDKLGYRAISRQQ